MKPNKIEDIPNYRDLNFHQIMQIQMGIIDGIDVSQYANPKYSEKEMEEMRLSISNHKNICNNISRINLSDYRRDILLHKIIDKKIRGQ